MEYLTSAANALLGSNRQDLCIPLTPKKGSRPVFAELTSTVNFSPDKFHNSPLQALFTAPTINTPKTKTKSPGFSVLTPGSRHFNGITVKFHTSPSTEALCRTPKRESFSPRAVGGCLTPKNNGASPRVVTTIKSDSSGRSPFTPMTNLKLLTRVASMEESLSSKKVLFRADNVENQENEKPVDIPKKSSIKTFPTTQKTSATSNLRRHRSENGSTRGGGRSRGVVRGGSALRKHPTGLEYPTPSSPGNLVIDQIGYIPSVDESITVTKPTEGSRKDKSLGLLSEKFLEHFPLKVSFIETPRRLVIDEVASTLGTERRRVYDIINVLESLSMASRVQKNMYQWMGSLHLEDTLGRLKALAMKMDIGSQLQALQHSDQNFKFPQRIKSSLHYSSGNDGEKDNRREKSLGILCQKFLMLLLVSPEPHVISMDSAVKMLLVGNEPGDDGDKLRTRGRRLYDIANVLTSLHLVKRVPTAKAFQYIGPSIEPVYGEEGDVFNFGVLHRHSLLPSRSSSTDSGRRSLSSGSYGDSEVTPSDNIAPPPQQKRGRPRKLSTDFTATLPASKRSRIQRARSEDVLANKESSPGLSRTPSLHDICQVAEVERERLLETERVVSRASSAEYYKQSPGSLPSLSPYERQNTKGLSSGSSSVPFKSMSSITNKVSILQKRLTKSKVPVALTFQSPPSQKKPQQTGPPSKSKPKTLQGVFQPIRVLQMQSNGGLVSRSADPVSIKSPVPTSSHLQVANSSNLLRHHSDPLTQNVKLPRGTILSRPLGSQSTSVWQPTGGRTSNANINNTQMMVIRNGSNVSGTKLAGNLVSRVVPVNTQSPNGSSINNPQVIKVITRTTGPGFTSHSDAGSTIITVLPAMTTAVDGSIGVARRNSQPEAQPQLLYQPSYVLDTSNNCFTQIQSTVLTQVSPRPQLSPRIVVSNSSAMVLQRSASMDSHVPFFSQASYSAPQTLAAAHGMNMPLASSTFLWPPSVSPRPSLWQPSPESSSTDSELESIFGDSFSFTRPKSLVRNTSLVSSQTSVQPRR